MQSVSGSGRSSRLPPGAQAQPGTAVASMATPLSIAGGQLIRQNGDVSKLSEQIRKGQADKLHVVFFYKGQNLVGQHGKAPFRGLRGFSAPASL